MLFYLGFLWKKYNNYIQYSIGGKFIALVILLTGLFSGHSNISIPEVKLENPILFLVYSLSGCYLLLGVATILNKSCIMEKIFSYIGRNSIIILLPNILCIRTLHLIRYYCMNDYHIHPMDIPHVYNNWYWWIIYTIISVIIPIGINKIYHILSDKVRSNITTIKSIFQ